MTVNIRVYTISASKRSIQNKFSSKREDYEGYDIDPEFKERIDHYIELTYNTIIYPALTDDRCKTKRLYCEDIIKTICSVKNVEQKIRMAPNFVINAVRNY